LPLSTSHATGDVIQAATTNDHATQINANATAIELIEEAPLNAMNPPAGLTALTGDGATNDSTNATAQLAAINGGKWYLPRGHYRMLDVAIPDEGVTIIGDGQGTPGDGQGTVIETHSSGGATSYALKAEGKRYLRLQDLVIDGNNRTSRGLLYEAVDADETGQNLYMDRVRFYQCTRGWHLGDGAGGVSQADKNTLINCGFIECDYGIYNEAANSQETVLINADFTTTYNTSIHMTAGALTMLGGQFQGFGAAGTKGIMFAGSNIDWVSLQDVVFEGPDKDIDDGGSMWPRDGVRAVNTVFQGPTWNVHCNTTNGRLSAKHSRFNADFDPVAVGAGIVTFSQTGGLVTLENCDYAVPNVTGANPPQVVGGGPPYATAASAAGIDLPFGAQVVKVTGTTTVTTLTAGMVHAGRRVTLVFAAGATFDITDGSNLKMAGSATTLDADDTITFVCDGTNWHETGRSAN
jgi:hypothetical protein